MLLRTAGREQDAVLAFKAALIADPTMKLPKSNTKKSVRAILSNGTTSALAIQLLIVFGLLGGYSLFVSDSSVRGSTLWATGGLLGAALLLYFGLRQWKIRKLRKADPELLEIYSRLQKDKAVS